MVFILDGAQVLPLRTRRQGTLHHSHTPAQRDGHTPHGPCAQQHAQRRADTQGQDGRQERLLDSRHRPCQHCHRVQGGRKAQGKGAHQGGHRQGGVPALRMGVEGRARRYHTQAAAQARRLMRLGAHPFHHGAGTHQGRNRHLLLLLPQGHDIQGSKNGQLGSCRSHRDKRRRGYT